MQVVNHQPLVSSRRPPSEVNRTYASTPFIPNQTNSLPPAGLLLLALQPATNSPLNNSPSPFLPRSFPLHPFFPPLHPPSSSSSSATMISTTTSSAAAAEKLGLLSVSLSTLPSSLPSTSTVPETPSKPYNEDDLPEYTPMPYVPSLTPTLFMTARFPLLRLLTRIFCFESSTGTPSPKSAPRSPRASSRVPPHSGSTTSRATLPSGHSSGTVQHGSTPLGAAPLSTNSYWVTRSRRSACAGRCGACIGGSRVSI